MMRGSGFRTLGRAGHSVGTLLVGLILSAAPIQAQSTPPTTGGETPVTWSCPMHPKVNESGAGACPICNMPLVETDSPLSHQDHSPKHGGIFFMAPDNWHHLEGAYSEDGNFRVYVYDNFSQPMNARAFSGRAVTEEVWEAETKRVREIIAFPLLASANGDYLEADVGPAVFPSEITAKLKLGSEEEHRFDFIFADFSSETVEPNAPPVSNELGLSVPATPDEIVFAISERDRRIEFLIRRGKFNEIWRPALETKDLALALDTHLEDRGQDDRRRVHQAMKTIVRTAWQLDTYGDQGDRMKIEKTFTVFSSAVETLKAQYGVD